MKFVELKFIFKNSVHIYNVYGELRLVSDDYINKRAVITLENALKMLPFTPGEINVKVAIDEVFVFECTEVFFQPSMNTLDLKIVATDIVNC